MIDFVVQIIMAICMSALMGTSFGLLAGITVDNGVVGLLSGLVAFSVSMSLFFDSENGR
ncbi:hypothetical protein [Mesorhizobium sp. B2-8-3]|uniref:hypothetical protein n=1 Tax=Mesorhizobium sp. B2-8-3 TaxID=2589905 RepID=UPI0015E4387A|nr:hypothetical protein [Mesorhizobium sp. B2-8-3]